VDVRVKSDERGQRRVERPINVGLRHRRPMFEDVMRAWGAEILDETKQRCFIIGRVARTRPSVAVVIARNREDGSIVHLVRFVKLNRIIATDTVEVDDVAQMIKKQRFPCRVVLRASVLDLVHHQFGKTILRFGTMNSAAIADGVEDHPFGLCNPVMRALKNYVERNREVYVVGERRPNKRRMMRRRRNRIVEGTFWFAEYERNSHWKFEG